MFSYMIFSWIKLFRHSQLWYRFLGSFFFSFFNYNIALTMKSALFMLMHIFSIHLFMTIKGSFLTFVMLSVKANSNYMTFFSTLIDDNSSLVQKQPISIRVKTSLKLTYDVNTDWNVNLKVVEHKLITGCLIAESIMSLL